MSDYIIHTVIHTPETAPADATAALAALTQRIGFLPNLAAIMAASPVLVNGFVGLQGSLAASTLTPVEREVVALTVSCANRASYPMALHSTVAAMRGAAPEVVAALRAGTPPPDAKLSALYEFTNALLLSRGHVDAMPVKAMQSAGYSDVQLFEVIAQVGFTSIANWVANLCDPPLDDAFRGNVWPARS